MNPDEMYYLNGPDEFVNPNESTSSQEEIEKAAEIWDADYNNGYSLVSGKWLMAGKQGYIAGALSREAELAAYRQSIAELTKFLEGFTTGIKPQTFKELAYLDEIKSAIEQAKLLQK
jgi:hypothetical protein